MFKYELNQVVFYMRENKIHSAPVLFRSKIDGDSKFGWGMKNCKHGTSYGTCHGLFSQEEVFESKEALVGALLMAADNSL